MATKEPQGWLVRLQRAILGKLNQNHAPERGRSNMYQGTVERKTIDARRAKNKVARRSRRINRQRSKR